METWSKTIRKLDVLSPVPTDIDIANSVTPLPISDIADSLNLSSNHYDLYGKYKAKVPTVLHSRSVSSSLIPFRSHLVFFFCCSIQVLLSVADELEDSTDGYYVVVAGITPTPLGEGKSTTTVGLCQALGAFLDKKVGLCFPSRILLFQKICFIKFL